MRWARGALLVAVAAAVPVLLLGVRPDEKTADGRRVEAEKYAEAVRPVLTDAGRVVVLGIRAALTDYSQGKTNADRLRGEAQAWDTALGGYADRLRAVEAPAFLERAKTRYLEALAGYRAVGRRVAEVADAPVAARAAYVTEIAALGNAADRVYDEADALVAAATRSGRA